MAHRIRILAGLASPVLLGILLVAPAAAQGVPGDLPVSHIAPVLPLEDVMQLQIPAANLAEVAKEDRAREAAGMAPRYAVPSGVMVTPALGGTWETLGDGRRVWRLRILAPGAASLNLGFRRYRMPPGGRMLVYAADESSRLRPFTAADNEEHGELWTPVLLTEDLVVDVLLAEGTEGDLALELSQVGWGYRGFGGADLTRGPAAGGGAGAGPSGEDSGACNVDVVCPQGDPWRLEIPAIAVISTGGSLFCSGFMVNDTSSDLTPYFMTARHCGITAGNAPSLVAYWNYENSWCRTPGSPQSGQPGDGTLDEFNTGSLWHASYSPSDFTLVELDDDPNPQWNISYAGWDATGVDATSAVGIHHPNTEEKRISFENDPTTTTSYLGTTVPGDGTHVRVTDWDLGTTEPGSSGSPLFNQNHEVIGQLHGGYASCTSQTSDYYGKFAVSFTGGGTPSSRLSDWLDAAGTGILNVPTVSLATLCSSAGTVATDRGSYACQDTVVVDVVDCDLNLDPLTAETIQVIVDSTTEPAGEVVTLTETGINTARFSGPLGIDTVDAAGTLWVSAGDVLTATYIDADDGQGGVNVVVTATALVDCTAPVVFNVQVSNLQALSADVSFDADEPVLGTVDYGTSCGSLTSSVATTSLASSVLLTLGGLAPNTTYFFAVTATDEAGNVTVDDNGGVCYTFTTLPAPDYFTEQFDQNDNDLDNRTILFTPDPGPDGYVACGDPISSLPTNPQGGTTIVLGDDASTRITLGGGLMLPLYGKNWDAFWVGSNGYVTFGGGDSTYLETLADHFGKPRIAALFDDLDPSSGGTVSWKQLADRVAVTWSNVPEYSKSNQNTFQIEMYFDGRIRVSWLSIAAQDGIAGLSEGLGLPGDFFESDLTGYATCGVVCQQDLGFGGPGTATLSLCGGDLSAGTTADLLLDGAPPGETAWIFAGTTLNPTHLLGGTLVPVPALVTLILPVDSGGQVLIPGLPGGGGPFTFYLQSVYADPAQTLGFGFSNALQVDILP